MAASSSSLVFCVGLVQILVGHLVAGQQFDDYAAYTNIAPYQNASAEDSQACDIVNLLSQSEVRYKGCISDRVGGDIVDSMSTLPLGVVQTFLANTLTEGGDPRTKLGPWGNRRRNRLIARYGDVIVQLDTVLRTFFRRRVSGYVYDKLYNLQGQTLQEAIAEILETQRRRVLKNGDPAAFWEAVNTLRGHGRQFLTLGISSYIFTHTGSTPQSLLCPFLHSTSPELVAARGSTFISTLLGNNNCPALPPTTPAPPTTTTTTPTPRSCGTVFDSSFRVINGAVTDRGEYPFLATLTYNNRVRCTATIIDSTHAMTAAHCTRGLSASTLAVGVAEYDVTFSDGEQYIPVTAINQHPQYDNARVINDISILTLSRPIDGIANAQPVCLPAGTQCTDLAASTCTVAGWGAIENPDTQTFVFPTRPYDATVTTYRGTSCPYNNKPSHQLTQLCAGGPSDTCSGDSGGPLVCQYDGVWVQCGITSFGNSICNQPGDAGIYTDVSAYTTWINSILQ